MYFQMSRMVLYLIFSEQTSAGSLSLTTVTTSGDVTEATVMGLPPFTNYDCYVTASTSVGEGPPSSTLTQRTAKNGGCELNSVYCSSIEPHTCIALHRFVYVLVKRCGQKNVFRFP